MVTELVNALRALLKASRRSWVTHHVWMPDERGRMRCVLPQCQACEVERRAERMLERWGRGE